MKKFKTRVILISSVLLLLSTSTYLTIINAEISESSESDWFASPDYHYANNELTTMSTIILGETFPLGHHYYTVFVEYIENDDPQFDYYIIGIEQTWNPSRNWEGNEFGLINHAETKISLLNEDHSIEDWEPLRTSGSSSTSTSVSVSINQVLGFGGSTQYTISHPDVDIDPDTQPSSVRWDVDITTLDAKSDQHTIRYQAGIKTANEQEYLHAKVELNVEWGLYTGRNIQIHEADPIVMNMYWRPIQHHPTTPTITGPYYVTAGYSATYTFVSSDPNENDLVYTVYWGDGTSWESGEIDSGYSVSRSHTYNLAYYELITVVVRNTNGLENENTKLIRVMNYAPNTPSKPSGPYSASMRFTVMFSFQTTDTNGDSIRYLIDWGDGSTTTTSYYSSGTRVYRTHAWAFSGTQYIKVRAQDSYGLWSSWSTSASILIENFGPN